MCADPRSHHSHTPFVRHINGIMGQGSKNKNKNNKKKATAKRKERLRAGREREDTTGGPSGTHDDVDELAEDLDDTTMLPSINLPLLQCQSRTRNLTF